MEHVTFEIAKKLKDKGFPQHITDEAYIVDNYGDDECDIGDRLPILLIPDYVDDIAAPTISQTLKWLREGYHIHIEIVSVAYGYDLIINDTPDKVQQTGIILMQIMMVLMTEELGIHMKIVFYME